MTDKDFQQHIGVIKQLLGVLHVPSDEYHIGIFSQIYQILNSLNDECDNRSRQAELAAKGKDAQ